MATVIMMKNPNTGVIKKGFYGVSWTTFWFGGFPAFFRGDLITGLVVIILNVMTFCVAGIIWAFFYNKAYTLKLIEKGFQFVGSDAEIDRARNALEISTHYKSNDTQVADIPKDYYDSLEKLASLRDKNIITEEEFQQQKAKILG